MFLQLLVKKILFLCIALFSKNLSTFLFIKENLLCLQNDLPDRVILMKNLFEILNVQKILFIEKSHITLDFKRVN